MDHLANKYISTRRRIFGDANADATELITTPLGNYILVLPAINNEKHRPIHLTPMKLQELLEDLVRFHKLEEESDG